MQTYQGPFPERQTKAREAARSLIDALIALEADGMVFTMEVDGHIWQVTADKLDSEGYLPGSGPEPGRATYRP
jgi:hypothetical protein